MPPALINVWSIENMSNPVYTLSIGESASKITLHPTTFDKKGKDGVTRTIGYLATNGTRYSLKGKDVLQAVLNAHERDSVAPEVIVEAKSTVKPWIWPGRLAPMKSGTPT